MISMAANEAVGTLRSAKSSRNSDSRLHPGAPVIEVPDAGWRQVPVGHPGAIDVAPESEKRGLSLLFGNESSRHDETTGLRPAVRTMLELGHLPNPIGRFISQTLKQPLEGPGSIGPPRRIAPVWLRGSPARD